MFENIIERYKDTHDIELFVVGESNPGKISGIKIKYLKVKPWKGFILRNMWILFVLPTIHKNLASEINGNFKKIVLTHDYFTKSPYLLRYLKIKSIYLCQEPQREFYEPASIHAPNQKDRLANILRFPIHLIDEANVRKANKIICNSKYSKSVLKIVYDRNCDIIFPGVNVDFFKPGINKKEKKILCVGGINPVKDQLFLINSLRPILPEYKLILVGGGKDEYIKKIKKIGGRGVVILNSISDSKLRSLYRKAMVTCISAHTEPFGLSSIESQACGTPVVSVKEGGPAESIIDGKTGFLSNRNTSEFFNNVSKAIKNHNRMGIDARKNVINKWTWDRTLNSFDRYLK